MPSGYTSYIYDGKIRTGKEFIMKCARAFGATIEMREESLDAEIPEEFKPSPYYLESAQRQREKLAEYEAMTLEEAEKICEQSYQESLKSNEEARKDREAKRSRYEKVLAEVKEWTPPTSSHIKLKEYAIKQIEESVEWDCSTKYITDPIRQNPAEWLEHMISYCKKDIERDEENYRKEVERINERNQWIKDLRASLIEEDIDVRI